MGSHKNTDSKRRLWELFDRGLAPAYQHEANMKQGTSISTSSEAFVCLALSHTYLFPATFSMSAELF